MYVCVCGALIPSLLLNPPLCMQLSFQLLDARYHVHKTLCAYVLDLNRLHSKKLPDFLQTLVLL